MFEGDFDNEDIRSQFREDIRMVVNCCGSNMEDLTDQLLSLHDFALGNGISEGVWVELVTEIDPDICKLISFSRVLKIAA